MTVIARLSRHYDHVRVVFGKRDEAALNVIGGARGGGGGLGQQNNALSGGSARGTPLMAVPATGGRKSSNAYDLPQTHLQWKRSVGTATDMASGFFSGGTHLKMA